MRLDAASRAAQTALVLTTRRSRDSVGCSHVMDAPQAFADQLGAELHVLRVVCNIGQNTLGAPRDLAHAIRQAVGARGPAPHAKGMRPTPRRSVAELENQRAARQVHRSSRSARSQAGREAHHRDPGARRVAPAVIELARRTDRGVLVLSGSAVVGTLIAATDLADARMPLLRRAEQLGRELQAAIVAVHNLKVAHGGVGDVEQTTRRLTRAARAIAGCVEPVVRTSMSATMGIVNEARARRAELIVVGSRSRPERPNFNTAARLIERAPQSVGVEPLQAASP